MGTRAKLDVKQLALLYGVVRDLSGLIELDALLRIVIAKAKEILHAESAAILLWDPDTDELYFPYIDDVDTGVEDRFKRVRFPAGKGIAGWVLRNGEPDLVLDARDDPRWYGNVDRQSGMTTVSLLCAPLRGRRGTIGVIQLRNKVAGAFSPADLDVLDALANSVGGAIENARAYDAAQRIQQETQAKLVALQRTIEGDQRFSELVGSSVGMKRVFQLMESTLTTPIAVLLQGETGTGKELIARAIHANGPRRDKAFVAVDCAALPEHLAESQLFGHCRGAFTGAQTNHHGFFEVADGGTIFLDEIGDMPLALQPKLLRVLQERCIVRVGETAPVPIDVRVISATHVDLATAHKRGPFRADLYYRLAAFPIQVPPLRERRDDMPAIASRLLRRTTESFGKQVAGLSPQVLTLFSQYDWPGNVREMQNEIQRAVTLVSDGSTITVAELSPHLGGIPADDGQGGATAETTLKAAVEQFERHFIADVLRRQGGNVTAAAGVLGISRTGLHNKMRVYGMERIRGGNSSDGPTR